MDKTLPMLIANKAYEPGFGARPIKRYIQKNIEGKIATELIAKQTKAGETITIRESWIK
jgi:ATP-dependent Clp protease ATP-binding subunit ClpB